MTGFRSRFIYVDAMAGIGTWRRVKESDLDTEIMKPAKNHNCFASVQRFDEPQHIPPESGEEKELQWAPIYFDFDAEDNLEQARQDALKVVNFFTAALGVPRAYVHVWFSGRRGFHIVVEPECFEIQPHSRLTYIIKLAAMALKDELELKSFDPMVYTIRRVLRLPNSVHPKTRLCKVELYHTELEKMPLTEIQAIAAGPRGNIYDHEEYIRIEVVDLASLWWKKYVQAFEEGETLKKLAPTEPIQRPPGDFSPPVCVKFLTDCVNLPRPNSGNRAVMSMAAFYKDAGVPVGEAEKHMTDWVQRLGNIGDSRDPRAAIAMARSTCQYVYGHPEKYKFACRFMLSLGSDTSKIPCQHNACPWIGGVEQEAKELVKTDLSQSADSAMQGVKIEIQSRISGKTATPYVVPKKIRITCLPKHNVCATCRIARFNGNFEHEYTAKDASVLELFNVTKLHQKANIKAHLGIPKECGFHRLIIEKEGNVEEVRMIPPAQDFGAAERREYVVRKGYFLGYPIQTNHTYTVRGYPCKEPKTQQATVIFDDVERQESEVETFKMTPEIMAQLKVFQPEDESQVMSKFLEIHEDLETNVTGIWNRRLLSVSFDLVFHSCRGFGFQFAKFVKGWVELCVVGDSGCGKTSMIQSLRRHYRVSDMVAGGTARRTGLAYSFQELNKTWLLVWGILPLNDLGMLIIDEFGDLKQEDFALLTDARSSGMIKVAGIVTDETNARVRLVLLTNCKLGRTVNSYDCGCMALKDLIPGAEDIRRLDFALAVASGDVTPEMLNRKEKPSIEHVFTSYLCNQLVRWCWSRKPDQVEFTAEATAMILENATRMSKKYVAGDIPLVEPSDQRFKIARLSAAVAGRLFSTDEKGERLIVKPEHVSFAVEHLHNCYDDPHFKYSAWSKGKRLQMPDIDRTKDAAEKLKMVPCQSMILPVIRELSSFIVRDVEELAGNDVTKNDVMSFLAKARYLGLIEKRKQDYVKTPLLIEVIRLMEGS